MEDNPWLFIFPADWSGMTELGTVTSATIPARMPSAPCSSSSVRHGMMTTRTKWRVSTSPTWTAGSRPVAVTRWRLHLVDTPSPIMIPSTIANCLRSPSRLPPYSVCPSPYRWLREEHFQVICESRGPRPAGTHEPRQREGLDLRGRSTTQLAQTLLEQVRGCQVPDLLLLQRRQPGRRELSAASWSGSDES